MNVAIEIVGKGILVPATISVATLFLLRRLLSSETSQRYAAAVAFAAAFCAGYVLLPDWAALVPKRHWHWTIYLAPGAALIGSVSLAGGIRPAERWLLWLLAAFVSAWLLVPNWANLHPPRPVCIGLLTGYLFLLAAALEPLARRVGPATLLAPLTYTSACVALLIAASISVTYGQTAVIAAAAMAGCWIAACLSRTASARGLGLVYSVVVGGWAFIGCIEPRKPAVGLLLAAAAPLGLWCCVWGPLSRLRGRGASAVQTAVVLAVLAAAAVLVIAPVS
jgi:hypothetical protein